MLFLFSGQPALSQTAEEFKALRKELDLLKEGLTGLKREMQDLNNLVGAKPTSAPAAAIKNAIINIKGAPVKGDKNAKLVFIEFSDYQ